MSTLHPSLLKRRGAGARPVPASTGLSREEMRYLDLLAGLAEEVGFADPVSLLGGHEFTVDGVDFRLANLPEIDPAMLCLWCDFGEPDEDHETECLLDLLQSNALRYDSIAPMFALCPDTGLVVCSARLRLEKLNAARLARLVRSLAADAVRWQSAQVGRTEEIAS